MSGGIFSIGTSALSAAYTALRTTGNNIANVNTPGYTRQIVQLSPQTGATVGATFVGQGVAVDAVKRVYNDFLTQQAHQATSSSAQSETRQLQITQVANLFANPSTGLGNALDQFFAAVQDLTQRAGDPSARQALLSSGNLLASRFNDVSDRLQGFRVDIDQQLTAEIDTVNRIAREVAELNDKIALARGSGSQPNDLLDRRDAAIRRLNESARVSVVVQDDGAANLYLGNGQPLVVGNRTSELGMGVDPVDPQDVLVGVKVGPTLIGLTVDNVGGGKIAGLLQFRSQDLPMVENELGRLAVTLADQFNIQHRLGNDRNGNPGANFFSFAAPTAFAAAGNGTPATTVSATVTDSSQLIASDYRVTYASAGGGQYTLHRLSDGATWTSATPSFTRDGLSITLASTPPSNGDSFVIQAVRSGARTIDVTLTQPAEIAAANPVHGSIPATNIGSLSIDDLSVLGPVRNPNVALPVTLTFTNATTYTYSINGGPASAPQTYTAGTPIQIDGWSLTLRGTPVAGDQVLVTPTAGAVGDNRNALKLAQLQSLPLVSGGQLAGAYAGVVARIGGEAQAAEDYNLAQQAMLSDSLAAESSVAGVNLDEEASRLLQYQQQYQAAAKIIAAAKVIFDEILNISN